MRTSLLGWKIQTSQLGLRIQTSLLGQKRHTSLLGQRMQTILLGQKILKPMFYTVFQDLLCLSLSLMPPCLCK